MTESIVNRPNFQPITGRLQIVDQPNANGRIYPRGVLEEAIKKVPQGRLFATLGMQEGTTVDLAQVAAAVGNLRIENDYLMGDFAILETEKGKELRELLKGTPPDYRLAGIGQITPDGVITEYSFVSVGVLPSGTGA